MSELEFEKKINEILKIEINNAELFINNDFNSFYTRILNQLNIFNINQLISIFNEEEMNQYHKIYTSLENIYLLIYVYIDNKNNIHSNYIENIKKDDELIPYSGALQAKTEMKKYIEILKNKYQLEANYVQ